MPDLEDEAMLPYWTSKDKYTSKAIDKGYRIVAGKVLERRALVQQAMNGDVKSAAILRQFYIDTNQPVRWIHKGRRVI